MIKLGELQCISSPSNLLSHLALRRPLRRGALPDLVGGSAASHPLLVYKLYIFLDTSHEPRAGWKRCKDVSPPLLAVAANGNYRSLGLRIVATSDDTTSILNNSDTAIAHLPCRTLSPILCPLPSLSLLHSTVLATSIYSP